MRVAFLIIFFFPFFYEARCQLSVQAEKQPQSFPLVTAAGVATIVCDSPNDSLARIVSRLLQGDIRSVTGLAPSLQSTIQGAKTIVLIGNSGDSKLIRQLVHSKKIDLKPIEKGWETFLVQVVPEPFAGVDQALVITGSDRRGLAYGVLELSQRIGVSPLHWWANVPAAQQKSLYVQTATPYIDAPKVKYRGLFINDEAPALSSWSREKFGGFNHLFYQKVFELLLRMKANYLWPAMWGSAFYDDDTLNKKTADDWGIVIGTSHHEPLMRAHDEWRRYGSGKWSFDSNAARLKDFWKAGMKRATNEKIITIGMRGDGDEPMSTATATDLLERIVAEQRVIIEEVTGKPAAQTPQLWALYKEVQDYYDKGMRVPDDVTLLLCDDNWGNIRRLPHPGSKPRKGGYGIYYHFDYVGGPRNYKWLNTNNIARVWEQMHLAYAHGAEEIWIVNVGDIKPMELPLSFFLDHAWNPDRWNAGNVHQYYASWASQQFGKAYAQEISNVLSTYAQYSARVKPELLSPDTYHLRHYGEAERVKDDHAALEQNAEDIYTNLPAAYKDAYYDLVLHPVKALTNLVNLYNAVAWNRYHAAQGDTAANVYADQAKALYQKDSLLTIQYHSIAGGKWNHMMAQTHIGYTYWQQPETNVMPAVSYVAKHTNNTGSKLPQAAPKTSLGLIPQGTKQPVFYERDGVVSIEAAHWSRVVHAPRMHWKVIPNIGKTGSGITTHPATAATELQPGSPHVAYDFYAYDSGDVKVQLHFSPTLDLYNSGGLKYALSIDGAAPQVFTLNSDSEIVPVWERWVAKNEIEKVSNHILMNGGRHTLKYWALSPGVVLQKAIIDFGGLKASYLGPPETIAR